MHYQFAATPVAAFFLALLLAGAPSATLASARVGIDPLQVVLPAKSLATSVNLTNQGRNKATFQAEVFAWSQVDGQDVLTPTREIVVAPPVFRIAGGARQVIRVGRLRAELPPAVEKSYRLLITEVSPAGSDQPGVVATALRLSLPVAVPPATKQALALDWRSARSGADDLELSGSNLTNATARIVRISLLQDGQMVASRALIASILPGASQPVSWKGALKKARPGAPLDLLTEFANQKTITNALDLGVVSIVPR